MYCCCAADNTEQQVVSLTAEDPGKSEPAAEPDVQGTDAGNSEKYRDFPVSITKKPGMVLGLELDLLDDVNAQICGIENGCVSLFNETAPTDQQVKVGDFIVEVNGYRGTAQELLRYLKTEGTANIMIRRSTEFTVSVSTAEGGLGLELQKAPRGTSLLIYAIKDGLISAWNTANPNNEVKVNDRIVSVNGHRGNTAQMMKQIKEVGTLELEILSIQP